MLLLGLGFCGVNRKSIRFDREDYIFFGTLLAYPIVLLLAVLVQGGKWTALDYPWRVLAVIPIALMVKGVSRPAQCATNWIWGWQAGAIVTGVGALIYMHWLGWWRVGSHITNEIPYGQIAAILALGAFLFARFYRTYLWLLLSCLAGLGGIYALAASGSRGAWLAFIAAVIFFLVQLLIANRRHLVIACVLTLACGYALNFSTFVQSRLEAIHADVNAYNHGNADTSTGVRLDLWRLSAEIAKEHPLFGAGPGHFKEALAPKLGEKPFLANFAHAHSQYFDTLANAGFIGLAGLLVSFLAPLVLFWGRLRSNQRLERVFALQGCGLIIVSMVACLTQPLYAHNISVIFYFICLSVCWGFSSANAVPAHRLEGGME